MSLFNELKRRNVFRVGLAYLVSAWIVAQVAGLVLDSIEAPAWVMQALLLMLGLGFIVALVIAWAYELTPDGIKKEKDVVHDDSITNITAKKLDYITLVAALGVLSLFVYQQMNPPKPLVPKQDIEIDSHQQGNDGVEKVSKSKTVDDASIAVLPFVDLSPQKNQGYFSDGIAEEILNVLVRIDSLKVASRTSAFGFKGQESLGIPLIAQRLKVRHILEGSVRKSGENVRITAQLIDAQTDTHLWSQTFDRQLTTKNIFAVQDEIAAAIVKQLGLIITDDSSNKPSVKVTTKSLDAYELNLKAQSLFHIRSIEKIPKIIKLYEQAVAIDPNFAEAWAGLSHVYLVVPGWGLGSKEDSYPKSLKAANRATLLDSKLALPYAVRGAIRSEQGDMIGAIMQMNKALKIDSKNLQTTYIRSAKMLDLGYFKKAEAGFRQCLGLDPKYEICRRFLSIALLYQGDVEEAAEMFEDGMLNNQLSYRVVFMQYYSAIEDNRALKLLLSTKKLTPVWEREMDYRYQTDNSFSLVAYNTEIKAKSIPNNNNAATVVPERTLESMAYNLTADFLWSPYLPELRRPMLRDDYLRVRKKTILDNGLVKYWRKYGFPPQCRALGDDNFECDLPSVIKP